MTHRSRGILYATRKAIDNKEKRRRHQQRDQSEGPAEIEHHQNHAEEREHVHEHAEQRIRDQTLNRVDVAGNAANQIAGPFLIMERKRKALNVVVNNSPQIVHDPLADRSRQNIFEVGTDSAKDRDAEHREYREVQDCQFVASEPCHGLGQPLGHGLRSENVIEDNF